MKQYYSIKNTHPDAILLFRVGDFYETFGDDAIKASEILGITLTILFFTVVIPMLAIIGLIKVISMIRHFKTHHKFAKL